MLPLLLAVRPVVLSLEKQRQLALLARLKAAAVDVSVPRSWPQQPGSKEPMKAAMVPAHALPAAKAMAAVPLPAAKAMAVLPAEIASVVDLATLLASISLHRKATTTPLAAATVEAESRAIISMAGLFSMDAVAIVTMIVTGPLRSMRANHLKR